jgi:hypothetical protein
MTRAVANHTLQRFTETLNFQTKGLQKKSTEM